MKHYIFKKALQLIYWILFKKGTELHMSRLLKAGWELDVDGFWVEPNIKDRDKIWIKFENHYYRIYHGEDRTFVSLESRLEWLQLYLFSLDYHGELKTRKLI